MLYCEVHAAGFVIAFALQGYWLFIPLEICRQLHSWCHWSATDFLSCFRCFHSLSHSLLTIFETQTLQSQATAHRRYRRVVARPDDRQPANIGEEGNIPPYLSENIALNSMGGSSIGDKLESRRFPVAAGLVNRSYTSPTLLDTVLEDTPEVTQEHVLNLYKNDEWKVFLA